MKEGKQGKSRNRWTSLLEAALKGRLSSGGNVLVLGAAGGGQRELVAAVQKAGRHAEGPGDRREAEPDRENLLVDFAYVQATRAREEELEELGKVNLYLVENLSEMNSDFLAKEAFVNLLVLLVADLKKPEELAESLKEAYAFAEKAVGKVVAEADEETKKAILSAFGKVNRRLRKLGQGAAASKEPEEEDSESAKAQSENEAEAPANAPAIPPPEAEEQDEGGARAEEPDAQNRAHPEAVAAVAAQLPLLVVGTGGECLDSINDESLSDYILYTLRSFAVSRGGSAAILSSGSPDSAESIAWLIFAGLLDKWPEKLPKPAFFFPASADSAEKLAADFPKPPTFNFRGGAALAEPGEKRPAVEIKSVADFLADLSRGKFEYSNEDNESKAEGRSLYNSSLQENLSRILGQEGARDRLSSVRDRLNR